MVLWLVADFVCFCGYLGEYLCHVYSANISLPGFSISLAIGMFFLGTFSLVQLLGML